MIQRMRWPFLNFYTFQVDFVHAPTLHFFSDFLIVDPTLLYVEVVAVVCLLALLDCYDHFLYSFELALLSQRTGLIVERKRYHLSMRWEVVSFGNHTCMRILALRLHNHRHFLLHSIAQTGSHCLALGSGLY